MLFAADELRTRGRSPTGAQQLHRLRSTFGAIVSPPNEATFVATVATRAAREAFDSRKARASTRSVLTPSPQPSSPAVQQGSPNGFQLPAQDSKDPRRTPAATDGQNRHNGSGHATPTSAISLERRTAPLATLTPRRFDATPSAQHSRRDESSPPPPDLRAPFQERSSTNRFTSDAPRAVLLSSTQEARRSPPSPLSSSWPSPPLRLRQHGRTQGSTRSIVPPAFIPAGMSWAEGRQSSPPLPARGNTVGRSGSPGIDTRRRQRPNDGSTPNAATAVALHKRVTTGAQPATMTPAAPRGQNGAEANLVVSTVDQHRFYSRSAWEALDDLVVAAPLLVVCECTGDCSAIRKRKTAELFFAGGHRGGAVSVFECSVYATGKRLAVAHTFGFLHSDDVTALACHNGILFSCARDGMVRKVDIAFGRIIASFAVQVPATAMHVDGNLVGIGTSCGDVFVFAQSHPTQPHCHFDSLKLEAIAVSLDAVTGEVIMADGLRIACSNILRPETFQWVFQCATRLLRTVIVLPDVLLAVSFSGWMYCIRRRESSGHDATGAVRVEKAGAGDATHFYDRQDVVEQRAVRIKHTDDPRLWTDTIDVQVLPHSVPLLTAALSRSAGTPMTHADSGRRIVTVESDSLLRVWSWECNDSVHGTAEVDPGTGRWMPGFRLVSDIWLSRRRDINHVTVLFDRFCLLTTSVGIELYNCRENVYTAREEDTERCLAHFAASTPTFPHLFSY